MHRITFSEPGTADIDNLYARIGTGRPHIAFAGHTDVVPPGDETPGPIGAVLRRGRGRLPLRARRGRHEGRDRLQRRGHAGLSCGAWRQAGKGSISFLITGDEEDIAVNGTVKLMQWAAGARRKIRSLRARRAQQRRGARRHASRSAAAARITARCIVDGVQGHVAYPHRADNPMPDIAALIAALCSEPLDRGSAQFQPSNLEFTSVDVGNPAANVIPGQARAKFNIRFNDHHSQESLRALIESALAKACRQSHPRAHRVGAVQRRCVRDQAGPVHRSRGRRRSRR